MDWLAENWFFVMLFVAFIAMHLFGHGHGHGGHGGHDSGQAAAPHEDPPRSGREPARHSH
jgi:hypothetical protein